MYWENIIKNKFTKRDIDNFLESIEYTIENITKKMFKKKYKAGSYVFDMGGDYEKNYTVIIKETRFLGSEIDSSLVFQYEFSYEDEQILYFATCKVAGTADGEIKDIFFDKNESAEDIIMVSGKFMRQPNVREKMNEVKEGLEELTNKV